MPTFCEAPAMDLDTLEKALSEALRSVAASGVRIVKMSTYHPTDHHRDGIECRCVVSAYARHVGLEPADQTDSIEAYAQFVAPLLGLSVRQVLAIACGWDGRRMTASDVEPTNPDLPLTSYIRLGASLALQYKPADCDSCPCTVFEGSAT